MGEEGSRSQAPDQARYEFVQLDRSLRASKPQFVLEHKQLLTIALVVVCMCFELFYRQMS